MRIKAILLAFVLGLSGVLGFVAAPGVAQTPTTPALVRIDLVNANDVARVAALDVPVYAHLTAPTTDYLLAILTPDQQKRVALLGLPLTILDPNATGASYYLLESDGGRSGTPVTTAASFFDLLHDDGRHTVGRLRSGVSLNNLDTLPVRFMPLLDPIVLVAPITGAIPTDPPYDPLVADLLTYITTETVAGYAGGLSGEWPISVGGAPYTLLTRYSYSGTPIAKATQYVYEHMQSLGYAVRYHTYSYNGYSLRNVIGEKQGLVHPDKIVLLTAHLDSISPTPYSYAPGADDNASGSTALLIAADLLADLSFDYTIRLIFFTGEEQGMRGSDAYAAAVYSAGENILGVLNFDMISWDAKDDGPNIDLHSNNPAIEDDSDALADLVAAIIDVYDLDLIPQIVENGATFSDHLRFWQRGYAAIMGIEDYYNAAEDDEEPRDWNTNYHTVNDRLSTLNLTYFREYVRAAVAAFVHLAGPLREISGTVMSQESPCGKPHQRGRK